MRYLFSISVANAVLMALACTAAPAERTPDIEATVDARLDQIEATVEATLAQERALKATVDARSKEEIASQATPTTAPTNTPVPTAIPTRTPKPTATPTPTPRPTATPRPTPTRRPTVRPTSTPNPALGYYDDGREHYDNGEYQLAINDFSDAIYADPDDQYYPFWRGASYYNLGEETVSEFTQRGYYRDAISDFSKAIQLDRDIDYCYFWRGISHRELKEYEDAIDDYTKAIELDPDYAEAYYWRGDSYYRLDSNERALDDAQAIIRMGSTDTLYKANNLRGMVYADTGEYSQAIAAYSVAIQLEPENGVLYSNRAENYRRLGQDALAEADEKSACYYDVSYC